MKWNQIFITFPSKIFLTPRQEATSCCLLPSGSPYTLTSQWPAFSLSQNHVSHGNDTILFYYYAFSGTFTSNNVYIVTHTHQRTHFSRHNTQNGTERERETDRESARFSSDVVCSMVRLIPPFGKMLGVFPLNAIFVITWWLQLRLDFCAWMHLHQFATVKTLAIIPIRFMIHLLKRMRRASMATSHGAGEDEFHFVDHDILANFSLHNAKYPDSIRRMNILLSAECHLVSFNIDNFAKIAWYFAMPLIHAVSWLFDEEHFVLFHLSFQSTISFFKHSMAIFKVCLPKRTCLLASKTAKAHKSVNFPLRNDRKLVSMNIIHVGISKKESPERK